MRTTRPASTHSVQRFETASGAPIFQIPLQAFPGLWGYVYVVLVDDPVEGRMQTLIDAGSGFGESNAHLEAGLQAASEMAGEPIGLEMLTHILITHGHIDHFGGLNHIRPRSPALLGIHELDRRILTHYEERLVVVACRLEEYWIEAGIHIEKRKELLNLYTITKALFHPVPVDFTYETIGMRLGPFEMLHVPGHCAGHVVIRLDDILFSGDHILEHTSPHQSPERLTLSTGLGHYLQSLEALRPWAREARITLGGHEKPIENLERRITEIQSRHRSRLDEILALLASPHTIAEISDLLFGDVQGYNALLALEEAGAHIEYLYQRGLLGIENLGDLENTMGPVPIRYFHL